MIQWLLAAVAVACLVAAVVWGRSARHLNKVWHRVERQFGPEADATVLARTTFRKELHATLLYSVLFVSIGIGAFWQGTGRPPFAALVLIPVIVSVLYGRDFIRTSRIAEDRFTLERRAEEVLSQEELAPMRWAARLAPEDLPDITG